MQTGVVFLRCLLWHYRLWSVYLCYVVVINITIWLRHTRASLSLSGSWMLTCHRAQKKKSHSNLLGTSLIWQNWKDQVLQGYPNLYDSTVLDTIQFYVAVLPEPLHANVVTRVKWTFHHMLLLAFLKIEIEIKKVSK